MQSRSVTIGIFLYPIELDVCDLICFQLTAYGLQGGTLFWDFGLVRFHIHAVKMRPRFFPNDLLEDGDFRAFYVEFDQRDPFGLRLNKLDQIDQWYMPTSG
jgi:hypothetical protein